MAGFDIASIGMITLRHSAASVILDDNINLFAPEKVLRHKSVQAAKRYVRLAIGVPAAKIGKKITD